MKLLIDPGFEKESRPGRKNELKNLQNLLHIHFTKQMYRDGGATMVFVIEKVEKVSPDFSENTVM